MTPHDEPSWDRLREEAATWLADMDAGAAPPEAFEAWRDASPRHAAAFAQVANALMAIDRVKPALKENVPPVRATNRRKLFITAAALGSIGAVGTGLAVAQAKTTVTTGIGERKPVKFSAGGSMQVNTDSRVQWRAKDKLVEVWLRKGELVLDLSGTKTRCRLHAADRVADIDGGTVNARLRGNFLDLAVVSGNCALALEEGNPAKTAPIQVPARHVALVSAEQKVVRELDPADAELLAGWPKGELIFQGQTLDTVVAEYNRYLTRKIVIADSSLASVKLGGRFTTRDPSAFLKAVHESFGIQVLDDGTGTIGLTK